MGGLRGDPEPPAAKRHCEEGFDPVDGSREGKKRRLTPKSSNVEERIRAGEEKGGGVRSSSRGAGKEDYPPNGRTGKSCTSRVQQSGECLGEGRVKKEKEKILDRCRETATRLLHNDSRAEKAFA